jgi:hypothetical protein
LALRTQPTRVPTWWDVLDSSASPIVSRPLGARFPDVAPVTISRHEFCPPLRPLSGPTQQHGDSSSFSYRLHLIRKEGGKSMNKTKP